MSNLEPETIRNRVISIVARIKEIHAAHEADANDKKIDALMEVLLSHTEDVVGQLFVDVNRIANALEVIVQIERDRFTSEIRQGKHTL